MIKRAIQTSLFAASIMVIAPVWSYGGFGAFTDGLAKGMQQGMELRLRQQRLELMEQAEKRDEERHQALMRLRQERNESRLTEMTQVVSNFVDRHPAYHDKERFAELRAELERLKSVPENGDKDLVWLLEEGNKAVTTRREVDEAKINNSHLVHWENNDPNAWDEALRQDEVLRSDPKWLAKTYPERFAEVVRRVRAIMPEASEPGHRNTGFVPP
jgi:hypothetical protein